MTQEQVPGDIVAAVHQLYGRQSHLIDGGDGAGWAATFTTDGRFTSPSYPGPVVGTEQLTAFAERFAEGARAAGEVRRHVVTTVAVETSDEEDALDVRAYLQIVATPSGGDSRLVRLTTLSDRLVRVEGAWRVRTRTVQRDDVSQQNH